MKNCIKEIDPENIQVLDKKEFGRRVRIKRQALQMSQETLAEKIGASVETVKNIENAHRGTSLNRLLVLAKVLHTTPNYLLAITGDSEEDDETIRARKNILDLLCDCDAEELLSAERLWNVYVGDLRRLKEKTNTNNK